MPSAPYSASQQTSPAAGLTSPERSALLDAKEREIIRLRRQVAVRSTLARDINLDLSRQMSGATP